MNIYSGKHLCNFFWPSLSNVVSSVSCSTCWFWKKNIGIVYTVYICNLTKLFTILMCEIVFTCRCVDYLFSAILWRSSCPRSYCIGVYVYLKQSVRINTGAYGMELPDIFLLSVYIFIFNQISLIISSIFPLHNVFVSIYPYNLMYNKSRGPTHVS